LKSRYTTLLLVLGLAAFGAAGAFAASAHIGLAKGHHHAKKHAKHHALKKHHRSHHTTVTHPTTENDGSGNGDDAAGNQYGTRPGKGCGDRNHVHTGPPGNPSNTSCPPQSQHTQPPAGTTSSDKATRHAKHHARHHSHRHSHKFGKNHKH
jgi:hypothetical protein